jgi:hypothetical protein
VGRVTGRDVVAVIVALALGTVLVAGVVGSIQHGVSLSGDGVFGGIVGALLVILARYVEDRRWGG